MKGSQNQTVVIVGAGQAAAQAVASLRNEGFNGKIVLIGSEPFLPYQRPPLSKSYLAGALPLERLFVRPSTFYEQARIETMLGVTVARLNLEAGNRSVETSDGQIIAFDYLVLATGGRVRRLSCDGASHPRLGYLRNVADAQKLQTFLQEGAELILIGGGYAGAHVDPRATHRPGACQYRRKSPCQGETSCLKPNTAWPRWLPSPRPFRVASPSSFRTTSIHSGSLASLSLQQ